MEKNINSKYISSKKDLDENNIKKGPLEKETQLEGQNASKS